MIINFLLLLNQIITKKGHQKSRLRTKDASRLVDEIKSYLGSTDNFSNALETTSHRVKADKKKKHA